jgi:hypothetical protein
VQRGYSCSTGKCIRLDRPTVRRGEWDGLSAPPFRRFEEAVVLVPDRVRIGCQVTASKNTVAVVDPDADWLLSNPRSNDEIKVVITVHVASGNMNAAGRPCFYVECRIRADAQMDADSVPVCATPEGLRVGYRKIWPVIPIEIAECP